MKKNLPLLATAVLANMIIIKPSFSKEREFLPKIGSNFISNDNYLTSLLKKSQFIGRAHLDSNWYSDQKLTNKKDNSFDTARIRLGIRGEMSGNVNYAFETDFAHSKNEVKDAIISYDGFENTTITFGQTKPTFSVEILESSNHMMFIERSEVTKNFAPPRLIGTTANKRWEKWRIAGGIFRNSINNRSTSDDNKYALSARVTTTPIDTDNSILHLGAATSYSAKDNRKNDPTNNNIHSEHLIGAELVAQYNALNIQGEYILNNTEYNNSISSGRTARFLGYYIESSIFLTGERRQYVKKDAELGKVSVKRKVNNGGLGALELAARFASLNRNNSGIIDGKTNSYTLGANWYANDNTQLMINYMKTEKTYNKTKAAKSYDSILLRMRLFF